MKKINKKQKLIVFIALAIVAVILVLIITTKIVNNNKIIKEENQKYKETIDKAIGYLKKWGIESDADMYWRINEYKEYRELLAILKEVE